MEYKVTQKFVRETPRKLRLVADMVRGLPANDVVAFLPFVQKAAAQTIEKAVKTALAAAKEKGESPDSLVIKEIQINEGPRLKRWRAGARGRAKPYVRRMSHVKIVLEKKADTPKVEPSKDKPQKQNSATPDAKSLSRGTKKVASKKKGGAK